MCELKMALAKSQLFAMLRATGVIPYALARLLLLILLILAPFAAIFVVIQAIAGLDGD
ncbi:hypothetical protein [Magnetofaba australis]|uniref:hypothetical protein n=1 Tax=Magnetofaba australis TaxID=1472297 RepID=UPI001301DEE6|nr:hypothetical protein [Magnetofaba australis]